ncbi:MAG: preprotein translocase subunit SecE [Clostridia bacterium]|nr:preprotein translocase subunit SecE [Clostridia bacterium]
MKTGKLLHRWIAAISAALLMISLFALPVFADDATTETEPQGLSTAAWVWIIIGAVLLVAAVVLGIKFREQIVKGLRVMKSEFKKVSWLSWEQTRKSTRVVILVLLACAIVICLLDLGLSKGFLAMISAFQSMFSGT